MHSGITAVLQARGFLSILADSDAGSKLREWSSLIGIITAIIGNILISFALNIQRYAHIRLSRERLNRTKSWNSVKGRKNIESKYGTQQEYIAEERVRLNLDAPTHEEEDDAHQNRYHGGNEDGEIPLSGKDQLLQGSSHSEVKKTEQKDPVTQNTSYLRSPYWWAGILLMTVGEAGNFLAYGFAPASIVSPLGVVALVSNCIIAPCLLRERFRQRDFWGVVVAVGGAVTVVLSAKNSETKMGPDDVWVAITRWEFELYLGITAVMMIVLAWASGKYGEKTSLIDLGLVGLFGGYTALSTKGVASLLSDTLWRALTFPITYLLVFVLVATALLQIRYLNRALQRFDSTQVIPTQFVLFTLSVIIGSAVLYRDFESATIDRVSKFVGGCALTFLGVYLITSGRSHGNTSEDGGDMDNDEEGMIGLVDDESYDDEVEEVHEEANGSRRKSLASAMYDKRNGYTASRQPSHEQSDDRYSAPRTPQRFNSYSSSTPSTPFTSNDRPDSPLLENPWLSAQDKISQPMIRHPLQGTISSPVLPTEAQGSRPGTERAQTQQPMSPSRVDRPSSMSRNSISRLMPGPLTSPLSSSFAAIVADSQRRGVNSPARHRRRLSGLRSSRSQKLSNNPSETDAILASSPLKSIQAPEDIGEQSTNGKSRSQSMSNTLGDFFSFKRDSRSEDDEEDSNGGVKRLRKKSGR